MAKQTGRRGGPAGAPPPRPPDDGFGNVRPRLRKRASELALKIQRPAEKLPGFIPPQLATLAARAPEGDEWLHEIKFDGYRLQVRVAGPRKVTLFTRSGLDWTAKLASVAHAFWDLRLPQCVIDGELVILDARGRSDFGALQRAIKTGGDFVFYAFDLLHLAGRDLTTSPQIGRKERLAELLAKAPADGVVRFSDHQVGHGGRIAQASCEHDLEGIVSKRAAAKYLSGRSDHWLKVKCSSRQEFVVIGWWISKRGSGWVGSLALGFYEKKRLVYAGAVGTGWSINEAGDLAARLKTMEIEAPPPIENLSKKTAKGLRFIRPDLVAEVEFRAWTDDGVVRHASFKGLREDKKATDVRLERPQP